MLSVPSAPGPSSHSVIVPARSAASYRSQKPRSNTAIRKAALGLALAIAIVAGVGCGADASSRIHAWSSNTISIARQPASHTAMAGERTTFEVVAKGVGPLSYQWMKNGERIEGANSARYTAPVAAADDNAQFNVIVENWVTAVSSDVATLRLLPRNAAEPAAFPISVSPNGRYLTDSNHKPFRIQGEAAWSLFSNLTFAEAEIYLSNRRAKSFNTVLVNLIEHKHAQGGKGADQSGVPKNRNGALPFVLRSGGGAYDGTWGTADFSSPNDEYFAFADSIIDLAADKGILVDLYPMFLGFNAGDAGWWADLTNKTNTRAVAYKFGEYVGRRYKDRKNIIWTIGGDFFPPPRSEGEARLLKFMEGVKAGGANQLWSGDWSAPSLSTDEPAFEASMDLNAVYTYGLRHHPGSTYHEAKAAYTYWPARPAFLKETGYEDEKISPGDAASVRMYEYYAILGGATAGAFFGNRDVWKFNSQNWWFDPSTFGHGPWTAAMESPALSTSCTWDVCSIPCRGTSWSLRDWRG